MSEFETIESTEADDAAAPVEATEEAEISERTAADWAVAQLAATQHGVVSRTQLIKAGYDHNAIEYRCSTARLHRIGPEVYAVGHTGVGRKGRARAALLHVGPAGGISHGSAARSWGMVEAGTDGPIHVTVPNRSRLHAIEGVVIHRPRSIAKADFVIHRGYRTTTPERTLRDEARTATTAELTRMLEQMVVKLGRSPDELCAWGGTLPSIVGRGKVLRALDELGAPAVIRSEFERLFRTMCQEAAIPQALTNHRVGGWEVDAVWPEYGLAVELDSWRFHGGRWQFHRDRKKGLAISRAGYELIRLTWAQVKWEQAEVVETLRLALARHAAGRLG